MPVEPVVDVHNSDVADHTAKLAEDVCSLKVSDKTEVVPGVCCAAYVLC